MSPEEMIESKITALLLGELPEQEAAELRLSIAADPELSRLHARLKLAIDLVRETVAAPSDETAAAIEMPRLSDERREKLLESFKLVQPKELSPSRRVHVDVRTWGALAAMLAGLLVVAGLMFKFRRSGYGESGYVSLLVSDSEIKNSPKSEPSPTRTVTLSTYDNGSPRLASETLAFSSSSQPDGGESVKFHAQGLMDAVAGRPTSPAEPNAVSGLRNEEMVKRLDSKTVVASRAGQTVNNPVSQQTGLDFDGEGKDSKPAVPSKSARIALPTGETQDLQAKDTLAEQNSSLSGSPSDSSYIVYNGVGRQNTRTGLTSGGGGFGDQHGFGIQGPAFGNQATGSRGVPIEKTKEGTSETDISLPIVTATDATPDGTYGYQFRKRVAPTVTPVPQTAESAGVVAIDDATKGLKVSGGDSQTPLNYSRLESSGLGGLPSLYTMQVPPPITAPANEPIQNPREFFSQEGWISENSFMAGKPVLPGSNPTSRGDAVGRIRAQGGSAPTFGGIPAALLERGNLAQQKPTARGEEQPISLAQSRSGGLASEQKGSGAQSVGVDFATTNSTSAGNTVVLYNGTGSLDGAIDSEPSGQIDALGFYANRDQADKGLGGNKSAIRTPFGSQPRTQAARELDEKELKPSGNENGQRLEIALPQLSQYGRGFVAQDPNLTNPGLGRDQNKTAKSIDASTLVQDGKLFFETGKYEEAESRLKQAIQQDPNNQAGQYYFKLLTQQKQYKEQKQREYWSTQSGLSVDEKWAENGRATREGIESKLGSIRVGNIHFDGLPLTETLHQLMEKAKKADPEKKGVNLIVGSDPELPAGAPIAVDPATGLPPAAATEGKAIGESIIKLDLGDVTLGEAVAAVSKAADRPIKLSIEPYAVVLSAATNRPPQKASEDLSRQSPPNIAIPQPEIQTAENAFSTFSLNASDVSFKLAAASLEKGQMPDPASVRSEEFINAFDYRDPEPSGSAPIAFVSERARYPFAHDREVVRFSVKTASSGRSANQPLNIVLLLDNSGSMERADRVSIRMECLRVLASQLKPQDRVSVVAFARTARLWVDGLPGNQAGELAQRVGTLSPEGGTNLEEAMKVAYQTALKHYMANGANRVVLLTDGAANLGEVKPESLKEKVETYRKQGIALDCFGIGWDGYNDDLLEALSRNGDGRYGFVNTPEAAANEFAGQLAGALKVAASDVKVQVEWNAKRVTAYRQIGYAKHQLKKEQFRDNTVDAAEIGAAEAGNALYVAQVSESGEGPLGTVRVRFKIPGTTDYREHGWEVPFSGPARTLEQASPALRLATTASGFSEWLVASPYAGEITSDALLGYLKGVPETCGADPRPKKLEWMIRQAKSLSGK